jgi:hypothetical protein
MSCGWSSAGRRSAFDVLWWFWIKGTPTVTLKSTFLQDVFDVLCRAVFLVDICSKGPSELDGYCDTVSMTVWVWVLEQIRPITINIKVFRPILTLGFPWRTTDQVVRTKQFGAIGIPWYPYSLWTMGSGSELPIEFPNSQHDNSLKLETLGITVMYNLV